MEWLVALILTLVLILLFGDILMMLAIRIGTFLMMLWVICLIQKLVVTVLVESGPILSPGPANLIGFAIVMFLCCSLLYWSSQAAASVKQSDVQTVALDSFRVGLVVAIGVALLITLTAVASGKVILVSWIWLMILAVFAAGLDVCVPSFLGLAVKMISPKVISSNGESRDVS